MLNKNNRYRIKDHEKDIISKTRLMMDLYSRYNDNIQIKDISGPHQSMEEELKLFIIPVPEDFEKGIGIIQKDLGIIQNKILNENVQGS
jgi:hypothetical protein